MTQAALKALIESNSPAIVKVAKIQNGDRVTGFMYYHIPTGYTYAYTGIQPKVIDAALEKMPTAGCLDNKVMLIAKADNSYLIYYDGSTKWVSLGFLIQHKVRLRFVNFSLIQREGCKPYVRMLGGYQLHQVKRTTPPPSKQEPKSDVGNSPRVFIVQILERSLDYTEVRTIACADEAAAIREFHTSVEWSRRHLGAGVDTLEDIRTGSRWNDHSLFLKVDKEGKHIHLSITIQRLQIIS